MPVMSATTTANASTIGIRPRTAALWLTEKSNEATR